MSSSKHPVLRPCVQKFAELMEIKLRENDHKGGWSTVPDKRLFELLLEECSELATELDQAHWKSSSPARLHVMREAADVANFAMMIADNAER
jgi:hypothetical protein